jgi:acetyl esterase
MVARMVFYHGGGWVLGELGDTDGLCQAIAVEMRCEVVSVAYRLAPEAPFPAAVNDAYAALMWSASLEDRQPLVVAGESSGGNLAAVTALRAREENGPELAAQVLIYPVTNHDFETPSYQRYGRSAPVLTRADMEWFWDHYVPDRDLRHDPFASPLRSPDLTGLPPAVVVLAGVDPVHDDGASFATRLLADGVPTSVLEYPDMPHGFFSMLGMLDDASRAHEEVCSALWHHLGVA